MLSFIVRFAGVFAFRIYRANIKTQNCLSFNMFFNNLIYDMYHNHLWTYCCVYMKT